METMIDEMYLEQELEELRDINFTISIMCKMDYDKDSLINTRYISNIYSKLSGRIKTIDLPIKDDPEMYDTYIDIVSMIEVFACLIPDENEMIKTDYVAIESVKIYNNINKLIKFLNGGKDE